MGYNLSKDQIKKMQARKELYEKATISTRRDMNGIELASIVPLGILNDATALQDGVKDIKIDVLKLVDALKHGDFGALKDHGEHLIGVAAHQVNTVVNIKDTVVDAVQAAKQGDQ